MLQTADRMPQDRRNRGAVGDAVVTSCWRPTAPLDGVRMLRRCSLRVAEILRSEVPLVRDLGGVADWKTIAADQYVRLHPAAAV
jgi:trehalose synthase